MPIQIYSFCRDNVIIKWQNNKVDIKNTHNVQLISKSSLKSNSFYNEKL